METTHEMDVYEVEVREIIGKLQQQERDTIAYWLARQHRLETEGPKGFSTVSVIVAWLLNRRYAITAENLTMALGNCQRSSHRAIHWKELPKQDRSVVGGRKNHAHPSNETPPSTATQPGFYPSGRRNHSYRAPEIANEPVQPADPWQTLIDLYMREWTYPSQRARLQGELDAGLAAGRTRREIAESLGRIVRDQRKGR
jgi:hypothetical protein